MIEKRAAMLLAAGLIGVPGIPMAAASMVDDDAWQSASETALVASENGNQIVVAGPPGWDEREFGNGISYRNGDELVIVQVFDRDGRDVGAVAQRLMRADRITGASAALTGEDVATADGSLIGQACELVAGDRLGECAFLADDDVIVWVQTLGSVDQPAPPLDVVLAPIGREQQ
ncbi:hypothetical protein H7J93_08610 [Mycobacterium barrassiae]|uniref:hypothetical protein n=1 Tax=Mycobacterium barrassiae TaxID=319709 RepID=UPI002265D272|nr:hypothetical protein [Mycobacterium barrassiae]MCV7299696.1 hypothetical protein [Mycobacterium barrassiae]